MNPIDAPSTNPNNPTDLLQRINAFLKAEQEAGGRGRTYHPFHPATLLAECHAVILHLQARTDAALRLLQEVQGPAHVSRAHPTAATQTAMQDARQGRVAPFATVDALMLNLNAPADPSSSCDSSDSSSDSSSDCGGGSADGS